jgi:hypothetical protein
MVQHSQTLTIVSASLSVAKVLSNNGPLNDIVNYSAFI